MLRHYPTLKQQQHYNIEFESLNEQLRSLFEQKHMQVLEDSSVLFL